MHVCLFLRKQFKYCSVLFYILASLFSIYKLTYMIRSINWLRIKSTSKLKSKRIWWSESDESRF